MVTGAHDEHGAFQAFLEEHPDYADTSALDDLRAAEYSRIDRSREVYLDYTGGGLYAASQVRDHAALLAAHVLGNPHSGSLSSTTTTRLVEDARRRVLRYFNTSADQHTAIFTANATGALKAIGEAFAFAPGGRLLLATDNHNSVNGIREFARAKGAAIDYAPLTAPDLRLDIEQLDARLARAEPGRRALVAFPAQSNFSGVRHPLDLVARARARGWAVLLDAAAFVPTHRLDLTAIAADFVSISFYKMFGYPTGVGCLLVRNESLTHLQRPWFAGGTVNFATVQGRLHVLAGGEAGFEDGTVNYLGIPAVTIGLDHLERIGLATIQARIACLTEWLLARLLELRHRNGRHMVRIYGPASGSMRGGTITFNLYDPEGHLLDYRRIEELATGERISLRTGCFCNPGAGETAEGLTEEDMLAGFREGRNITLPRFLQVIQYRGGKSAGAIRASLGLASNFSDAYRFFRFVADFRDQTRLTMGEVTFDVESCRVIRDGA